MTSPTGRTCLRPSNPRAGLTLVEVLVSIAILAASLAVILQGLSRAAYLTSVAKHRLQAVSFAQAKLAELELAGAARAELKPDGDFRIGRDLFTWHVASSPNDAGDQVDLTVSWEQGQHPFNVHVTTLLPFAAVEES